MIAIVNSGIANVRSVQKGIREHGFFSEDHRGSH